ncbi:MAG: hypothetical protein NTV34_05490 [Proteobacteria bacterium]|nr:hypothetical protein [Pseudomonadota bacterium]
MKRLMYTSLGLFFLVAGSMATAESLYEYKLQRFDSASQPDRCQARIAALATEFAQKANVSVFASSCQKLDYDDAYIYGVITYTAAQQVKTVRVMSPYGDGVSDFGAYGSQALCEADFDRQRDFFTSATGLEPLANYCYRNASVTYPTFGMQIEAIGETNVSRFVARVPFYSPRIRVDLALMQQIAAQFAELGGVVADVRVGRGFVGEEFRVDYYAVNSMLINVSTEIEFESEAACQANVSAVNSALIADIGQVLASFCDVNAGPRLAVVSALLHNQSPSQVYKIHTISSNAFTTRAACNSELPKIVADLSGRGVKVSAAVCGVSGGRFAGHVFVK